MSFYDSDNMDQKTMAERCREYYDPADFVVIINADTEVFTYIIQRPENVTIHQPSSVTKELYYTKDPDVITLQPGQTRMVPAYEADHAIKLLTDKMVYRNRKKIIDTGETPQESTTDPSTQHKYIKAIFQGKRDFMHDYNQQLTATEASKNELEQELEDGITEAARSAGRPKKQVA
jgi:hypothetical protein